MRTTLQKPSASGVFPARSKWGNLLLLSAAELFAMTLWLSASAVVPQLTLEWDLSGGRQSWMTMSVQIGFVVGALLSAVFNMADRIHPRHLIAVSALAGAAFNAAIPLIDGNPAPVFVLRILTGAAMAGVYPPGMKLMATWCKEDRGLGIGLLVGALTVGSAVPHLLNALPFLGGAGGMPPWRQVLLVSSLLAAAAALVTFLFVSEGPYLAGTAPFDWRYAGRALQPSANPACEFWLPRSHVASMAGEYDLVTAFECLHDMSDPVGALRNMRRLAGEDGAVLVVDERTGHSFLSDDGDIDAFLYGCSVLHCLPAGMADEPSAGTGTVMRPHTMEAYAREAGFSAVETLPIDDYFFRFYRLHSVNP